MKKYNIAYIFTPIEFGGAERVNVTFLKQVNRDRFCVTPVLLVRPWEKRNVLRDQLAKENYRFLEVPVALRPRSTGRDYFRIIRCLRSVHSVLKKGRFDLIHTHGYFADIVGIASAKLLGVPHIATCHGFISTDRKLKLYNWLDRISLRFSDTIIIVSAALEQELVQSGINPSRIVPIQNAVAVPQSGSAAPQDRIAQRRLLGVTDREFLVGYIGRLSEEKGLRYLLEAVPLLHKSGMPIRLVLIGDGPLRSALTGLAQELGIARMITFTGFQNSVEHWIPALDVFVLPSLMEGTPMALLEAMVFGIPVIASAVGGLPRVIDSGFNGILIRPGDPSEIQNALRLLYADRALRNSLSQQAKRTILGKYNIKDWIGKIEAAYVNTINARPQHTARLS